MRECFGYVRGANCLFKYDKILLNTQTENGNILLNIYFKYRIVKKKKIHHEYIKKKINKYFFYVHRDTLVYIVRKDSTWHARNNIQSANSNRDVNITLGNSPN